MHPLQLPKVDTDQSLQVRMLGAPQVVCDGRAVDWRSRRQAEAVLYFLVLNAGRRVPESELIQILWPWKSLDDLRGSRNNLKSIMSHLVDSLDPERKPREESIFVSYHEQGYLIRKDEELYSDVQAFDSAFNLGIRGRTEGRLDQMTRHMTDAMQIYRGPLLDGFERRLHMEEHWLLDRRQGLWQKAEEAVIVASAFDARCGRLEDAVRLCKSALKLDFSPLICGILVTLLGKAHRYEEAHTWRARLLSADEEAAGSGAVIDALKNMLGSDLALPVESILDLPVDQWSGVAQPRGQKHGEQLPPPHNIPVGELFVGREDALRIASAELGKTGSYVVVSGYPGFGATSFVAELARQVRHRYPGGVAWTRASSPLDLLGPVLQQIAQNWGLAVQAADPRPSESTPTLQELVAGAAGVRGPLLVVIDDLRTGSVDPGILTLPSHLSCGSKVVFVVSTHMSLDSPPLGHFHVGSLDEDESAELFYTAAERAGRPIMPQDDELVRSICSEIGGYPQGLAAAATRAARLPLKMILAEVKLRIPSPPESSIHTAIGCLSAGALRLLLRIACVPDTVGAGSLASLAGDTNWENLLGEILERQLVTFDGARYRMHRVVKECLEDLAHDGRSALGEDDWVKALADVIDHLEHMAEWALVGAPEAPAELANLEGLVCWAYGRQKWDTYIRAVRAVDRLLESRGSLRERSLLLKSAAEAASTAGDQFEVARFLNLLGTVACRLNDHDLAKTACQRALDIQKSLRRGVGIASNLGLMARIAYEQGHYRQALDYCTQSRDLWQEAAEPAGLAPSLIQLGKIHRRLGDFELARSSLDQGIEILERPSGAENAPRVAEAYGSIGDLCTELGDNVRAREYYLRALDLALKVGDKRLEATALMRIAEIYRKEARLEEADQCSLSAKQTLTECDDRRGLATCWNIMGNIQYDREEYEKAYAFYAAALPEKERTHDRYGAAISRFGMAKCQRRLGNPRRAQRLAQAALQDAEALQGQPLVDMIKKFSDSLT